jgi:hypothetical protein
MVLIKGIHIFVKSVASQARMPRPLDDCRTAVTVGRVPYRHKNEI